MTTGAATGRTRKKRPRKRTVEILGLDHVQIAIPKGEEALARLFYGAVLGLQEVRKQSALSGRGGAWFVAPGLALHLGVEDPFIPARKAHPAFLVANLAKARRRLATHDVEVIEDETDVPIERCYVSDPFGNRIELIDAKDAGFTATTRRDAATAADAASK